jgi:peroxiredoxin Q/BCP
MPPELRKRKAAGPAPSPEPKRNPITSAINKAKGKVQTAKEAKARNDKVAAESNNTAAPEKVAVGSTVSDLEGFGGEVETNDGEKTTLKKLLDESKAGVVLFTYPKASTPGCKSFSLFRSSYLCLDEICERLCT